MKAEGHPNYKEVKVICSCGNTFMTRSTVGKPELHIETCSACHPFYTGKQKVVNTGGRVDSFKKRYTAKTPAATPPAR
ncbi:MAG TPA: 50S ribosomal protein L31 [Nevskiaceae bacterium]|nr:50S ribosomal protein L31 [Nevskiaceae bacterium]